MPVTAKLSRKFYDTFGDDIANELVDWFNQVDATYRADLIQLNELNFARFDASMGERFSQHDAKWERRLAELDAKWERRLAELEKRSDKQFSELRVDMARHRADLTRWMFVFWAGTLVPLAAFILALSR